MLLNNLNTFSLQSHKSQLSIFYAQMEYIVWLCVLVFDANVGIPYRKKFSIYFFLKSTTESLWMMKLCFWKPLQNLF